MADIYTSYVKKEFDADIDMLADTMKISAHTNSYSYSAAHDAWDDASATEVSGTNYTSGGATLANKSTSSANPCVFDADDVVWSQSGAGFTDGRNLVHYKDSGTDNTSWLVWRFGAAANFGNVSGALTVQFAATGLVRATGS